ncbi:MAG: acyl-CoA dehydrogenase [Myxococcales bacterium]
MAELRVDLRDLRFTLFEHLRFQDLLGRGPYADFDRETVDMMLDEALRFSRDVLAPLNETSDRVGATFKDGKVTSPPGFPAAWRTFAENGWVGFTSSPEHGGQGAPQALGVATAELFENGCLSFALTRLLTSGAARLIVSFGTEALKTTYVDRMMSGEWTGTMCLTEAGAGSDVGASRTTARREGDHYLIEGEKIFITSGDHDMATNVIHAVLARTPDAPPGTKGLSLFVVPKLLVNDDGSLGAPNHVQVLRIEEKMGIHGSPTCVMGYGLSGPCRGFLLGREGDGMRQMFQMMNEARMSVGIEGVALGNAAYQHALTYARDRVQGGDVTRRKPGRVAIIEHPDVRRMLLWQKAHGEGIRALGLFTALCIDREEVAAAEGNEAEAQRWHGMLEVLTPVIKAYGSDTGSQMADMALQCFGGYGYTQEYPAEQLVRDVRISRIYEGTNGIQALDLVGRKLGQRGGADARALFAELCTMAESVTGPGLDGVAARVTTALSAAGRVVQGFASGSPLRPVLNATGFLELLGQATVGVLLGQAAAIATASLNGLASGKGLDTTPESLRALAEEDDEARFLWGKVAAARFFAEHVLIHAPSKADELLGDDTSAMDVVF